MAEHPPVVVYPPSPTGGRRVRARGEILGLAHGVADVVEFLRRAGLDEVDELTVETTGLIEWRGGGPDVWPEPPT
ncbi:hypothetical protein OG292_03120 [Streptomyces sp. NBC_01511]|uniref:hypothetical protein n=1 Tax=Streptomyces sp. NBC_01511 TaxID=2903889 RepID=UPI003867882F